jgi:ubiquinone/menaquinone biosynthesis C-methylase UbiE
VKRVDTYTHGHHQSVLRSHQWRNIANSASFMVTRLRPESQILDVGCGPGTISAELSLITTVGGVIGIDLSPEVLRIAREAHPRQSYPRLDFEQGDLYRLRFPDSSFDVVYAHQVLQHLSQPIDAIQEMRRVLRPGGIIALRDADYGAFAWSPPMPEFDSWMSMYQEVTRRNGANANGGRFLKGWVQSAGFNLIEVSGSVWSFSTPEDRNWWGTSWAERVLESDFARQAVEYGIADQNILENISQAFRRWSEGETSVFFVPNFEIIAKK